MKLILHIGMPKAGSSALQSSLRKASPQLCRRGLLYPGGGELPKNHNMLVCSFVPPPELPRVLRQVYGGDKRRVRPAFEGFMRTLEAAVEQNKPDILVLSGEMLFRKFGTQRARALKRALSRLSDEVTVVAYVRSPAQYYLSLVPQALKASSRISHPRPVPYRWELESYTRITDDIHVVAYERSALLDGDITRDFLHRFAPGRGDALGRKQLQQRNQTISAEGMDILHRYRCRNHAGADDVFTKDTDALRRAIEALEAAEGPHRPTLHPEIARYVNGASVDLIWLRDRHGIVFADVDYDQIAGDLPRPPPPQSIAEICPVDAGRRDRMLAAILEREAEAPWLDRMLATVIERTTGASGAPAAPAPHDPAWLDRTLVAIHAHLIERAEPLRFTTADRSRRPVSTP